MCVQEAVGKGGDQSSVLSFADDGAEDDGRIIMMMNTGEIFLLNDCYHDRGVGGVDNKSQHKKCRQ